MKAIKRIISFIGIISVASILICGCGSEAGNEDAAGHDTVLETAEKKLFDEQGGVHGSLRTGIGYNNDNSVTFLSDTNTINTTMNMDSYENRLDMGYMVFVDGILQPVSVDGGAAKDFNIVTVDGYSEYKVSFDLISGRQGESVRIDTISFLNPTFEVTENTNTLGNCFSTGSPLPYYAECKETAAAPVGSEEYSMGELPQHIRDENIWQNDDGSETNLLLGGVRGTYYQEGSEVEKVVIENGRLSMDVELYGGHYDKYNIYFFLNNETLNGFEGKSRLTAPVSADGITRVHVEADVSGMNIGKYTQLFGMAAPVGEEMASDVSVSKITSVVVINNDYKEN